MSRPPPLSLEQWQDILYHAYASCTMVDAAAGRVLDKLKELGLDKNTLIIYTTDHGDALGRHGGHFDKDSHMAMEVLRTPLAMAWKGHVAPGQVYDGYTFTCDVLCTLMDAAGLEFSNDVDGKSLMKLLDGSEPRQESLMRKPTATATAPRSSAVQYPRWLEIHLHGKRSGRAVQPPGGPLRAEESRRPAGVCGAEKIEGPCSIGGYLRGLTSRIPIRRNF